jgi:hypothetical protein
MSKMSPSKIKNLFESRMLDKMKDALKESRFPKDLLLETLKGTPRIDHGYFTDTNNVIIMAMAIEHSAITDCEVNTIMEERPDELAVLSLFSQRIPSKYFDRYVEFFLSGNSQYSYVNSDTNTVGKVTIYESLVKHPHLKHDKARQLLTLNNTLLNKFIADNASSREEITALCESVMENLDKVFRKDGRFDLLLNSIASNKMLDIKQVEQLYEKAESLTDEPVTLRSELVANHPVSLPKVKLLLEDVFRLRDEELEIQNRNPHHQIDGSLHGCLNLIGEGMAEHTPMSKEEFLEALKWKSGDGVYVVRYPIDKGLKRMQFTDAELNDVILDFQGVRPNVCLEAVNLSQKIEDDVCIEIIDNVGVGNEEVGVISALLEKDDLPSVVLDRLAYAPEKSVQQRVAAHPKVSEHTFNALRRVRQELTSMGERGVLVYHQSSAFSLLTSLNEFLILESEYGFDLFDFKGVKSPKQMTKMLIGSKHPQEVAFIFGSNEAQSVTALSTLQSVFTNRKGKLDRFSYIEFLESINNAFEGSEKGACRAGLAVDAQTLEIVMTFLSNKEMVAVLKEANSFDEAKDVFRILATLIERNDPEVNEKQRTLVRRWLDSKGEYGDTFHSYLTNKQLRDFSSDEGTASFYQIHAEKEMSSIKSSLPERVEVILPANRTELRELGRKQRHCVGTKYYADRCSDGTSVIFALVTGMRSDDIFTYQFDRFTGRLLQKKGFANGGTPDDLTPLAQSVFEKIKAVCEPHFQEERENSSKDNKAESEVLAAA